MGSVTWIQASLFCGGKEKKGRLIAGVKDSAVFFLEIDFSYE